MDKDNVEENKTNLNDFLESPEVILGNVETLVLETVPIKVLDTIQNVQMEAIDTLEEMNDKLEMGADGTVRADPEVTHKLNNTKQIKLITTQQFKMKTVSFWRETQPSSAELSNETQHHGATRDPTNWITRLQNLNFWRESSIKTEKYIGQKFTQITSGLNLHKWDRKHGHK